MSFKHPRAGEKPRADWENDLQTCSNGRKSRKRPTLVVDKKSNGECQLNIVYMNNLQNIARIINASKVIAIIGLQSIFAGCASQQPAAENIAAENHNLVAIQGNMGAPASENSKGPLEQGRWHYVQQHPNLPQKKKEFMLVGGVQVRWTSEEARASWGQPDKILQPAFGGGDESWIYPNRYSLDFKNGVVVRVHASGEIYKDGQE
jgi:hypothetical protein